LRRISFLIASLCAVGALTGPAGAAPTGGAQLRTPGQAAQWTAERLNRYWQRVLEKRDIRYRAPPYYYWYNRPGYGWLRLPRPCDFDGTRDGRIRAGYWRLYAPNSFYCGANEYLYLDWSFWKVLVRRSDSRVVVVMAHEWGHHVQHLIRWPPQPSRLHELMADCYAGAFMRYERDLGELTDRDVAQGRRLLASFGDVPGKPEPQARSHGSPAERRSWFSRGYEGADPAVCERAASSRSTQLGLAGRLRSAL
jgi:Putative neutral zinc metallopeptidase